MSTIGFSKKGFRSVGANEGEGKTKHTGESTAITSAHGYTPTAVKNAKIYGPTYHMAWGMPPGMLFTLSVISYMGWGAVDLLALSESVFLNSFRGIEFLFHSIASQGGETPNWMTLLTHFMQFAAIAYLAVRIYIQGDRSPFPFLSSFVPIPFIYALNAVADAFMCNEIYLSSVILLSVSTGLCALVYWWRPFNHWRHREKKENALHAVRGLVSHDSEPIEDIEYSFTDIPLKWLLAFLIFRLRYFIFTYGEIIAMPNLGAAISVNMMLIAYDTIVVGFTIFCHLGCEWDGVFGFIVALNLLLSAFEMASDSGNSQFIPSLVDYSFSAALVLLSLIACIFSYTKWKKTYPRKGDKEMAIDLQALMYDNKSAESQV